MSAKNDGSCRHPKYFLKCIWKHYELRLTQVVENLYLWNKILLWGRIQTMIYIRYTPPRREYEYIHLLVGIYFDIALLVGIRPPHGYSPRGPGRIPPRRAISHISLLGGVYNPYSLLGGVYLLHI